MKTKLTLFVAVLAVALLGVGCVAPVEAALENLFPENKKANDQQSGLTGRTAPPSLDNRSKVIQIDSYKIETRDAVSYVVGDAKNTSSETLHLVELNFHLFNSSGELVGEAAEFRDNMEPNSTWNFRAACTARNFVRAELIKVIVR